MSCLIKADQELSLDKQRQAIISFVVRLAHELNIQVIAEGVETLDQLSFLNSRKVNFIQGYYFYKPMSIDELVSKLRSISNLNKERLGLSGDDSD